jgi:hypothetical protein
MSLAERSYISQVASMKNAKGDQIWIRVLALVCLEIGWANGSGPGSECVVRWLA